MVKVIMGLKGSGKTKQMIDSINNAVKEEPGVMVCIEKSDKLRFDIDHRVRLIEAREYDMEGYSSLKGFISGLHAGNFDITHVFIDGLYKVANVEGDIAATEAFLLWCEKFGEANSMSFTITLSEDVEKATDNIKKFF